MKTDKEMFINVSAGGTRIALTESKRLVELHIERADYDRMVGNIYKGEIQNVIPGMQAAFIDIGYESNAFLPFSEISSPENRKNISFDDDDTSEEFMESVYKKELGPDFEKMESGVGVGTYESEFDT